MIVTGMQWLQWDWGNNFEAHCWHETKWWFLRGRIGKCTGVRVNSLTDSEIIVA